MSFRGPDHLQFFCDTLQSSVSTNLPRTFSLLRSIFYSWSTVPRVMVHLPRPFRETIPFQEPSAATVRSIFLRLSAKRGSKLAFGLLGMKEWIRIVVPISPIIMVSIFFSIPSSNPYTQDSSFHVLFLHSQLTKGLQQQEENSSSQSN